MFSITPLHIPLIGSLGIHGYGILVALGIFFAFWRAARRVAAEQLMPYETAISLTGRCILAGLVGARLWSLIGSPPGNYQNLLFSWEGGAILGGMAAVALYLPLALFARAIPLMPVLAVVAMYAPLAHAIGRLGCLWAGCCHGLPTTHMWGAVYSGITAGAPTHIALEPVQLYSALWYFTLFLILRFALTHARASTLVACYLIASGLERFLLDFLRDDRIFWSAHSLFSTHQWFALIFIGAGLILTIYRRP